MSVLNKSDTSLINKQDVLDTVAHAYRTLVDCLNQLPEHQETSTNITSAVTVAIVMEQKRILKILRQKEIQLLTLKDLHDRDEQKYCYQLELIYELLSKIDNAKKQISIDPTEETSWGLNDTYNIECNHTILYEDVPQKLLATIIANNNYTIISGEKYLQKERKNK